jgi:hypothetical protein
MSSPFMARYLSAAVMRAKCVLPVWDSFTVSLKQMNVERETGTEQHLSDVNPSLQTIQPKRKMLE